MPFASWCFRAFLRRHLAVQGDLLNTLWPLSCLLANPDRILMLAPHQERVFLLLGSISDNRCCGLQFYTASELRPVVPELFYTAFKVQASWNLPKVPMPWLAQTMAFGALSSYLRCNDWGLCILDVEWRPGSANQPLYSVICRRCYCSSCLFIDMPLGWCQGQETEDSEEHALGQRSFARGRHGRCPVP